MANEESSGPKPKRRLLTPARASVPEATQARLCRLLALAAGHAGMAGGQAIDLAAVGKSLTEAELRPLEQITSEAAPRLEVTADCQVELECSEGAQRLADGLAGLLLTIRDAQADGSWDRMKLCGNPDCLWAFYDRSHSRQGAWCDMASCGNRLKNRNLRARRAQAG